MRSWMTYSAVLALLVGVTHCSSSSDDNQQGTTTGSGANGTGGGNVAGTGTGVVGGGNTGGASAGGWGTGGFIEYACQGHIYECGDTIDNDNDGLIDWQDPDCLGPCDNNEGSFNLGIPGGNAAPCKADCYFDQDTGSGNDQCYWDHRCDPLSVAPNYYPEAHQGSACEYMGPDWNVTPIHETCDTLLNADGQRQACLDFCLPLVPNGCDCFGCCELPAESGKFVWLGSLGADGTTQCSLAEVENPAICHPCTPVTDCYNGCGPCELCLGKTPDDIPAWCFGEGGGGAGGNGAGGSPPTQCDPGIQPCGLPGQDPCPATHYCITGCCRPIPT